MDMMDGETAVRDYALERAIMLSDGVFAIAMTLLSFELRPPDHWDHTLPSLVDALAVPFQAFFWSFFATASFWMAHRRLFGAYRRADTVITIINLALLGEVVLIPLATRMLTGALYTAEALGFYLGLFALIGVTNAVSWSYAAFLTDIVRAPQRGPAVKLCVAFLLAVVPVSMTATGVLSALPGHLWTLALMPVVAFSATALRRAAAAIDGRRQRAPLPAPRMPGQVQAGQADAGPG